MILANLRQRFTPADWAFVVSALARGDERRRRGLEGRAAAEGPDTLLDDPGLPTLLRGARGHAAPSGPLFVYVMVRHALRRAGVGDARLADYVGALVFEFGLRDRAWRVTHHDDAEYRYLVDIMAEAASAPGQRAFLLNAHLGNFSLWLAGIFPDYITERRARRGGPDLAYYESLGAQGFRLASDDELAARLDLSDVLLAAAEQFCEIRVALNRLSDETFFRSHSPGRLLRQVADETRFPPPQGPLC
jgi:hypothetical protein